jgi:hypothetical protein
MILRGRRKKPGERAENSASLRVFVNFRRKADALQFSASARGGWPAGRAGTGNALAYGVALSTGITTRASTTSVGRNCVRRVRKPLLADGAPRR